MVETVVAEPCMAHPVFRQAERNRVAHFGAILFHTLIVRDEI